MKRKRAKADNLTKRREKWYVRVYYRQNGKNKEKLIPLRTSSKVTARARALEVRKVEQDIKQGIEFDFPWLTKEVRTKVRRFTIQDAVNQWMAKREGKLAKKTIDINKEGLNYFLKYIGDAHPLETVVTEQVESFIDWLDNRGLSKTTINIHLRTLKTMFRYYDKVEKLNKVPHIVQLSVPKTEPIYITDNEFQTIMDLGWLDDFYKRVFLFYRETGMRLNEPMMSVLKGNWMDIPNTSKSKVGRNIELDKPMQSIFNE
jgi:Site-specific recombinase XerD